MELLILGTSSSQPIGTRFPSCQILKINNDMYMIDCGEGAQFQLSKYAVKRNLIKAIFISHLHGDHIFGLPGVITSFMHYSRTSPLKIIGPIGLKKFIDTCLEVSESYLKFDLEVIEIDGTKSLVYSEVNLNVNAIELDHRITTYGYRFDLDSFNRNLIPEMIGLRNLTIEEIKILKSDNKVERENETIYPDDVCLPLKAKKSYAYISDTGFFEQIIPAIQEVDLLYHEATYLGDMEAQAIERKHSTTLQAATIAKQAKAKKLIIGHYSSRYKSLEQFTVECKSIFENSQACEEGNIFSI